ncbi:carboxypeptidase-like regulatory domain-containing protein [Mucilaginibacter myungsuensis]|uniref:Carboxypeptidase-like regulatory domain-containing protein n=1 Tax=Mucilaginibacter myungsuensis TaxID=649104 RepID=A0A929PW41_9SPHI|nr:carboxypeptidase-like regulatory domain-containing protein [Mucilaginibacter myungsuensis]MBE9660965.1 carboxypeptidase-like regulatory domain-containing protein [Mucilaginibacter myungsuensis]MDN3601011.1 carboxypeptidase-like regulatory domain-containing protein [Mucilaginibacter myungsuensis]
MLKNLILLLTLFPATLFAQSTISGRVVSMANKNGVAAASVFLSNTSIGTNTLPDGTYTLKNVRNGQYDLVVTCVGYEPHHYTVLINNTDKAVDVIELMPKVTELKEVTIKYDPKDLNSDKANNALRKIQLARFTAEFLGRTANASECKLLNPDILDLYHDPKDNSLRANAPDFLLIQNDALGYKIKYLLTDFYFTPKTGDVYYVGSFIFEPLTGDEASQRKWMRNRVAAYKGSDMHFLRACIIDMVTEEGFTVYSLTRKNNDARQPDSVIKAKATAFKMAGFDRGVRDSLKYWAEQANMPKYTEIRSNKPVPTRDYIRLTQTKGLFAIGYPGKLQIRYKTRALNALISFYEPFSFFDNNGVIVNPRSNTMEGAWAFQRVADLLPVDYELPISLND